MPNTYSFSKALSEDLVHSYKDKIPIVITRPTIVTAAWKEPFEGKIITDNIVYENKSTS